jgi:hypothetical protein
LQAFTGAVSSRDFFQFRFGSLSPGIIHRQLNSTVCTSCLDLSLFVPCPFGKWILPKGDVDGTTIFGSP